MQKELLIINQLITNTDFRSKVFYYLEPEYFQKNIHNCLFKAVKGFIEKYETAPSKEALLISLNDTIKNWNEADKENIVSVVDELFSTKEHDQKWLVDCTEEFCQQQALYLGLLKSIEIHKGSEKNLSLDAIPEILKSALAISFDTKVGLEYLDNYSERYNFYNSTESGIQFDVKILNDVTNNVGLPRKGLTVLMSATHAGKTLVNCHCAAMALRAGYNVVYITLEMPAERIAQRIDANMLDVEMDSFLDMTEDVFIKKMKKATKNVKGRLFIKEYPTSSAHSGHFRHFLEELKHKKGFVADLIIIDYINICMSAKYKNVSTGTYTPIKSIAEEIRAIGMEYNAAMLSCTQSNREGLNDPNRGIEAVAESMGVAHVADVFWSIFRNEQLDQLNKILFVQLKNRLKDLSTCKRFLVGVARPKMKLFQADENSDIAASYLKVKEDNKKVEPEHFKSNTTKKSFSDFKY